MSLDKAIESGKEKRKQYYGKKALDPWCRVKNKCSGCRALYKYKSLKRKLKHTFEKNSSI
jgi:hypothetical protein